MFPTMNEMVTVATVEALGGVEAFEKAYACRLHGPFPIREYTTEKPTGEIGYVFTPAGK